MLAVCPSLATITRGTTVQAAACLRNCLHDVPAQAICVAACYSVEWPLLIVCPSSVTITWLEALYTWLSPKVLPGEHSIHVISSSKVCYASRHACFCATETGLSSVVAKHPAAVHVILLFQESWWQCANHSLAEVQDVDKKLDLRQNPPTRHILITSYDLAQKLRGYERHFGMVICDESHALKNPASKRTQFFRALLGKGSAKRVLFLTGTPALSRPIELYTQVGTKASRPRAAAYPSLRRPHRCLPI